MNYDALAADHRQAVSEATQREQRALAELDAKKAEVRASATELRRKLESDFKSEVRSRRDAACAEVNDALLPIVASFHAEPSRALAGQLARVYNEQRAKILESTGFDIEQSRRIALVYLEAMRANQPDIIGRAAGPWMDGGGLGRSERAVADGLRAGDAAGVYAGLLALESALRSLNSSAGFMNAETVWAAKFNDLEGNQPETQHETTHVGPNRGSGMLAG